MTKFLQYYIRGGGSLRALKSDYVIHGQPLNLRLKGSEKNAWARSSSFPFRSKLLFETLSEWTRNYFLQKCIEHCTSSNLLSLKSPFCALCLYAQQISMSAGSKVFSCLLRLFPSRPESLLVTRVPVAFSLILRVGKNTGFSVDLRWNLGLSFYFVVVFNWRVVVVSSCFFWRS